MVMVGIRWLGHAAFEISSGTEVILIDPYLTGNPLAPVKASEILKADVVCVTHDHHDHLGDAIDICRRTGATFVGIAELAEYVRSQGVADVVGMNIGGTVEVKGVSISMVPAFHSARRGSPVGFVVNCGGVKIYHAGDTSVFSDMKLIGQLYQPDLACLPIGGYYTAGPREAAEAAGLVSPKIVIPMHYLTFPQLEKSADEFVELMKNKNPSIKVVVLKPGEIYHL